MHSLLVLSYFSELFTMLKNDRLKKKQKTALVILLFQQTKAVLLPLLILIPRKTGEKRESAVCATWCKLFSTNILMIY